MHVCCFELSGRVASKDLDFLATRGRVRLANVPGLWRIHISSGCAGCVAHFTRLYEQFRGITRERIYGGNICRSTLPNNGPLDETI